MPRKRARLSLSTAKKHPKSPKSKANQQSHKQTLGPKYKGSACTVLFHPHWEKLLEALGQNGAVSLNADVPPVICFA